MPARDDTLADAYDYRRVQARFLRNFLRRRKWLLLFLLLIVLSLLVTVALMYTGAGIVRGTYGTERDTYLDDVPGQLYRAVLRQWYNFSDGDKWYNRRNVSTLDPGDLRELLTNIEHDWIVWNHDPNRSYVLQEPEVVDPSMGQSAAIREIFDDKRDGFFIECGAYDGETRSNTLFLERFNGWSGLLIEADPINFTKMLQKNRRAYLSPTCLGVAGSPTLASFLMARNVGRLHEPENSTGSNNNNAPANTPDVAHTGEHVRVQCFPLALYVAALGVGTVDYLSLDVEGSEIDLLETIPFDELDIKTLSVEYIHNARGRKYMIDMMEQRGYYVYSFVERSDNLANDVIFVKRGT